MAERPILPRIFDWPRGAPRGRHWIFRIVVAGARHLHRQRTTGGVPRRATAHCSRTGVSPDGPCRNGGRIAATRFDATVRAHEGSCDAACGGRPWAKCRRADQSRECLAA